MASFAEDDRFVAVDEFIHTRGVNKRDFCLRRKLINHVLDIILSLNLVYLLLTMSNYFTVFKDEACEEIRKE